MLAEPPELQQQEQQEPFQETQAEAAAAAAPATRLLLEDVAEDEDRCEEEALPASEGGEGGAEDNESDLAQGEDEGNNADDEEGKQQAGETARAESPEPPAGEPTARRHHAIYEIIDSEESYVGKLRYVADNYIPLKDDASVQLPPDLEEKWSIVWGNWFRLLEGHEEILAKIKQAFQTDIDSVASVFVAKERHLTSWYSKYCENHRKAQHIACDQHREFFEQVRLNLRDKEDMNSHLMNPVQRCMRYSLLVGTVIDKARKDGLEGASLKGWQRMMDITRELPLKTESIMEASRIDNLEAGIRVTALGQVRIKDVLRLATLQGPYDPSANPPPSQLKFEQRKIFLFDQMMLVTEVKKTGKARQDQFSNLQTVYLYRSKVKMNNMKYHSSYKYSGATDDSDDELLFCVVDTNPGANVVYVFDPASTSTRTRWVVELRQMENQQMDFLKKLQNPVMGPSGSDETSIGGSAAAEGNKKSSKDKHADHKAQSRKKSSKLSFSGSRWRKSRAETSALPRPQTSRERKSSCPDTEAIGDLPDSSSSGRSANKELRKVPSEVGSSASYDQESANHTITKKKSGINFTSLQSFFTNKKSKSRSDSRLNPP